MFEHLLFPVFRTLFERFEYSSKSLRKLEDNEEDQDDEEELRQIRTNSRITDDHHNVRIRCTEFDKASKGRIAYFHRLKCCS